MSANWLKTILSRLSRSTSEILKTKHADWSASPLREMGLALSTKFDILSQAVRLTEKDVYSLLEQINEEKLNECFAKKLAYTFSDKQMPYRILLDLEALIFELRSTYEIVGKFLRVFFESILNCRIDESEIKNYLISKGVDVNWIDELRKIRILFFHNNAPWLALRIKSTSPLSCEPVLLKEDIKSFDNPDDFIHFEKIIIITNGFIESLNLIHFWIMEKIEAYEKSKT